MKTLFEHIAYAKKKPHHVRKRIAFAVAALCSGLVALVWLIGSFSLGSFAIQGSTFADSVGQNGNDARNANSAGNVGSGVAGAAAAIPDSNVPVHIEIVDTTTSTPAKDTTEQTTIPF
jgi:hypothetical protein